MTVWAWFRTEQQAKAAAEHDAALLRSRYGAEAEHWCKAGIDAVEPGRRKALRRIERALRHLPA